MHQNPEPNFQVPRHLSNNDFEVLMHSNLTASDNHRFQIEYRPKWRVDSHFHLAHGIYDWAEKSVAKNVTVFSSFVGVMSAKQTLLNPFEDRRIIIERFRDLTVRMKINDDLLAVCDGESSILVESKKNNNKVIERWKKVGRIENGELVSQWVQTLKTQVVKTPSEQCPWYFNEFTAKLEKEIYQPKRWPTITVGRTTFPPDVPNDIQAVFDKYEHVIQSLRRCLQNTLDTTPAIFFKFWEFYVTAKNKFKYRYTTIIAYIPLSLEEQKEKQIREEAEFTSLIFEKLKETIKVYKESLTT
jgi:hypothetical protein